MPIKHSKQLHKKQEGFALLITLVLAGVLVSIGLSILSLSIHQVRLASNAKDSEIAFHAANAGVECATYWRRFTDTSDRMEAGSDIAPNCFGVNTIPQDVTPTTPPSQDVTGGDVYQYKYDFTWPSSGSEPKRCAMINTIVGVAEADTPLVIENMDVLVPGFPYDEDLAAYSKSCDAGTVCTVISVQGFNKACVSYNEYGTVQREVLIQL